MLKKSIKLSVCVLLIISMTAASVIVSYADDSTIDLIYVNCFSDYNRFECSALGCIFLGYTNTFVGETSPDQNIESIRYISVSMGVWGDYCEGDATGVLEDFDEEDVRDYPSDVTVGLVRVVINYYGEEWFVYYVGGSHCIIDSYGNIASEGTFLDFSS